MTKIPMIPLGDKVLVELCMTKLSSGGVLLPEAEATSGVIRSIGQGVAKEYVYDPETPKTLNSRGFKVGDSVLLPRGKNSGTPVESKDGKKYILVPAGYISGIFQDDTDSKN